jgi:hypothetical protein
MSYKIINLTTGRCYNHNLPHFESNFPEITYEEKIDAKLDLEHIIEINKLLSHHEVKSYHLEIIEV